MALFLTLYVCEFGRSAFCLRLERNFGFEHKFGLCHTKEKTRVCSAHDVAQGDILCLHTCEIARSCLYI